MPQKPFEVKVKREDIHQTCVLIHISELEAWNMKSPVVFRMPYRPPFTVSAATLKKQITIDDWCLVDRPKHKRRRSFAELTLNDR